jgi:DNA helicase II / ATP-dependent DNA helicase PcrA
LLRKNSQLKAFILALQKKKIPYYVHQDVDLFDQKSVKVMSNLAKTICDPTDSRAFFQLLISGFFLGVDNHQVILLSALADRRNESLEDAIKQSEHEWSEGVITMISKWREGLADFSAGESLYLAIKESGYLKRLLKTAEDSIDGSIEVQYLTDFFKLVKQFELVANKPNLLELSRYLDDIKHSSGDITSEISPLDSGGVQLLTVHKAKGLEFDYVFLPDLVEQTFPTYRQGEKIKIPDFVVDPVHGDHYQEERRLFYVAMTRARQGLSLSFASNHGGKRAKKPSRFIAESIGQDWQTKINKSSEQTNISELLQAFEPLSFSGTKDRMLSRLFRGDWLHLTTNQIADYLRSPKEFWLFHVLCLPKGPFHTLVYGSAVHAALEHYYKLMLNKRPIKPAEVVKVFEQAWSTEGFASKEHEMSLYENGKTIIRAYIESHLDDKNVTLSVEQPFELQLPQQKVVISGRYDLVLEGDKGVEIRDFKTSRVKDQKTAISKAKSSIQLGIYALSWEKLQQKQVTSTSLEFVQDLLIGTNTKIDNEKTLEQISKAVTGIKELRFDEKGQSDIDFDKLII